MVHNAVNKLIITLIVPLLLTHYAFAIDTLTAENCRNLPVSCKHLESSTENLTIDQEKELVLALVKDAAEAPYHYFAEDWNRKLDFSNPPTSVLASESETIKGAWVKIAAVFPSVAKDKTFVGSKGTVMTMHGFMADMPVNYGEGNSRVCGSKPPGNEQGDCKTIYAGHKADASLQIYKNGQMIGTEKFVKFNASEVNDLEAVLTVTNYIQMKHYKWETGECCERVCGEGGCRCVAYYQVCKFDSDEEITDSLTVRDESVVYREGTFEDMEPKLMVSPSNKPMTASMSLHVENLQSFTLKTKNQVLKKIFVEYGINYTLPPQNVLHVTANDNKDWFVSNAKLLGVDDRNGMETFSFITDEESIGDCELTLQSYFNTTTKQCVVEELPETEIRLTTDKWTYGPNETIKLKIELLSDRPIASYVDIQYADQIKTVFVDGSLIADLEPAKGTNLIVVSMKGSDVSAASSSTMVNVTEKKELVQAFETVLLVAIIVLGSIFGINKLKKLF